MVPEAHDSALVYVAVDPASHNLLPEVLVFDQEIGGVYLPVDVEVSKLRLVFSKKCIDNHFDIESVDRAIRVPKF